MLTMKQQSMLEMLWRSETVGPSRMLRHLAVLETSQASETEMLRDRYNLARRWVASELNHLADLIDAADIN